MNIVNLWHFPNFPKPMTAEVIEKRQRASSSVSTSSPPGHINDEDEVADVKDEEESAKDEDLFNETLENHVPICCPL